MQKKPWGVIGLGVILILSSLDQLRHIPAFDNYRQINQGYPDSVLFFRYGVSFALRLVGLISGIGILFFKESFRRMLIGLSWFSIATLWLRHTYSAQLYYSKPIYEQNGSMFSLETFTWLAVLIRWLIDGIFCAVAIYYLTRPKVKESFR